MSSVARMLSFGFRRSADPRTIRMVRNPFGWTHTAAYVPTGDEWPRAIAKSRVDHDRDRKLHEDYGATLGPVRYREWTDEFGDMHGEWASDILVEAAA